jgi:hypothetical protein
MWTRPRFIFYFFLLQTIGLLALWSCDSRTAETNYGIAHVIVIGFDGLSPDGLRKADTPTFDRLMAEGAHTLHARAVLPSSSSPNWASMIMGAGPEQHGITSNAWERDNFVLPTVAQGDPFLFPTIFGLLDAQRDSVEIGAIYHWGGFGRLFEKHVVDFDVHSLTEEETAVEASTYLTEKSPHFTFVHFDHVDHAGHEHGHGTEAYYQAVEKADALLKQVVRAIEASPMKGKTLLMISSDHGGVGKGHGGESLAEMEIPFILWGAGVKQGYAIKGPVYQYDNAATVAHALGLKPHTAWIGRPVKEAFEGQEAPEDNAMTVYAPGPVFYPPALGYAPGGGLFVDQAQLALQNLTEEGQIRYTLDGSLPTAESPVYRDTLTLRQNTKVRTAVFKDAALASLVTEAYVRVRPKDHEPPIAYELYQMKALSVLPNFQGATPKETGFLYEFSSEELQDRITENTALRARAHITLPQNGRYTFYLRSDDGSALYLNGQLVVDNDGDHGVLEKEGSLELTAGTHLLEVLWFNGGGGGWLDVYMAGADRVKQLLPTTLLTRP